MAHPFQDKLFVFIGNPTRCSRQAARDALAEVGGVTDNRLGVFTHYIVAFNGAERTKVYEKAVEHDKYGHMVLLNEEQFFDVLEGKLQPPEKKAPPPRKGVILIPAKNPEANERDLERVTNYVVEKKRIKNMARYGAPLPGGGRVKVDFRQPERIRQIAQMLSNNKAATVINDSVRLGRCDNCPNPAKRIISGPNGKPLGQFCIDCHNLLIAEMTEMEMPAQIPKRLTFNNSAGEIREFEVEYQIFPNGKLLTATELGKTRRVVDVSGDLDADFNEMLETLMERIKKVLSVTYIDESGYIIGNKAVGYIEYNHERDACDVIIDGKAYSWADLEKNITGREGFKIKIEFGNVGDELD